LGHTNIAMLFFSKVSGIKDSCVSISEEDYALENTGKSVKGFQTNEAPLADILLYLKEHGNQRLDRIYCLVTKETLSTKRDGEDQGITVKENGKEDRFYDSQFDFWKHRTMERFPELTDEIFVPWLLKYDESKEPAVSTIKGQVAALADRIKKDYSAGLQSDTFHIYADITGGPRHVNMLMSSVIRFLQYDGMHLEKMVYSDRKILSTSNKVFDVLEIERLYTLIAGADAFIKYGSSAAIEEYFGYDAVSETIPDKPESQRLATVLRDMRQFSDAIQICQTSKIPKALADLKESLDSFSEIPSESRTAEDRMFAQLLDTIKAGYHEIFPHEGMDNCDQYLAIIRWCKSKGLLQQAMTLCTEWIPVYMVDKGICAPKDKKIAEATISNMHPGWKQNFIIQPNEYIEAVKKVQISKCKEQCRKVIFAALDGTVDMSLMPERLNTIENKKMLEAISGIRLLILKFSATNGSNAERLNKTFEKNEDIRKVLEEFVVKGLNKKGNKQRAFVSLLENKNYMKLIQDQLLKSEGNSFLSWILGFRPFAKEESSANVEKKWKTVERNWRKLMDTAQIIVCPESEDYTLRCLKEYYLLRNERNQINHATEKNLLTRNDVENLITNCLDALNENKREA